MVAEGVTHSSRSVAIELILIRERVGFFCTPIERLLENRIEVGDVQSEDDRGSLERRGDRRA